MGIVTTMEPKEKTEAEVSSMFLSSIEDYLIDLSLEVKKLSDAVTRVEEKLDRLEFESINRKLGR